MVGTRERRARLKARHAERPQPALLMCGIDETSW